MFRDFENERDEPSNGDRERAGPKQNVRDREMVRESWR